MEGTGEGVVERALSGGQMVPSGGLLPAKMAPAGAQMGSGNLINAGIVKKGAQEAEREGGIHAGSHRRGRADTPFKGTEEEEVGAVK